MATLLRRCPTSAPMNAVNPEWRPTFVLRGLKRLPASCNGPEPAFAGFPAHISQNGTLPSVHSRCDFATLVSIYWAAPALSSRGAVCAGAPQGETPMQKTLLGLAIAFIHCARSRARRAVLHRLESVPAAFEAEATRIIGAPVRVGGKLDGGCCRRRRCHCARWWSAGANDSRQGARRQAMMLNSSLSSLMRGEVRATELTINGMSLDLGLDPKGGSTGRPRQARSIWVRWRSTAQSHRTDRAA